MRACVRECVPALSKGTVVCVCVCVCVCVSVLQSHKDCTWEVLADVAKVGGPECLAAFRKSRETADARRKVGHIEWRPPTKTFKLVVALLSSLVAFFIH